MKLLKNKTAVCLKNGKLNEARETISEILREDENDIFAHANLANLAFIEGKSEEALCEFQISKKLAPR